MSSPSPRGVRSYSLTRLRTGYAAAALLVFNTLVLFAVLNLLAAWWLSTQREEPVSYARAWLIDAYGFDTLARNYPGLAPEDVRTLLHETSNWVQEYEPFTGFRPVERQDRFITIAGAGFRPVPQQPPWPPPSDRPAVFLFGGSTMMGAGVPDDATIASHVQQALADCGSSAAVYNFGRGFYFSTQERILFEQLLLAGHRPALAVFLDGLNDFYFAEGHPQFTPEMTAFMRSGAGLAADASLWSSIATAARQLPLLRAVRRFGQAQTVEPVSFGQAPPDSGRPDEERIDAVLTRWERNRDLIRSVAAASNVRTAFVWQPVPTYGYDQTRMTVYREGVDLFGAHRLSAQGYPAAAARYAEGSTADTLWLGEIQRDRAENLYVDAVHYTGRFSADIAQHIVRFLTSRALVTCGPRHGE